MKRIGIICLACLAVSMFVSAGVASATPAVNGATIETRTFNDCALSTLSTTNNYPASVSITDAMSPLCVGFANLHSFSFSADGGTTAAVFNNNSNFKFGADVTISGAGEGEGGLRLSPWYGKFVDGRFMANATSGEIACFGGAIPFYSFTVANGIHYTKGTTIRFEMSYRAHDLTSVNPATIQYRVIYNGTTYDSPELPFGEQNPNECNTPQHNGQWGMLNDGRAGGYFQARANTGASLTMTWENITFSELPADGTPQANGATVETRTFNDCSLSTVTTANNYPASVSVTDAMSPLCVGFANLHSFSFSADGGRLRRGSTTTRTLPSARTSRSTARVKAKAACGCRRGTGSSWTGGSWPTPPAARSPASAGRSRSTRSRSPTASTTRRAPPSGSR